MAEHTPTPWECDWGPIPPDGPETYCDVYIDGGDTIIARVNDCIDRGHANAEFIVKAVNNHDALVAELKRLFALYGHQATADVLELVGSPKHE